MSVRMKKELIEGGMQLRAAPQQFAVEAEAALPGGLRDEVRLFYTEAQAEPAQAEAVGNRLTVSGRVNFRALYAQGDLTRVRCAEGSGGTHAGVALGAMLYMPETKTVGLMVDSDPF